VEESFFKVINYQILTLATRDGLPDDRSHPILRFELEDGREFQMMGIPREVAYNLSLYLQSSEISDSRLQIHDLVGQLAIIEKVEIDVLMPGSSLFQATVKLLPEGFERSVEFQMVPSHATLLAILNDAPIFIAKELIELHYTDRD